MIDFFPTPAWVTQQFLETVALPGGLWLEPCAGDHAIVEATGREDVTWVTNDLQPTATLQVDYASLAGPLFGPKWFDVLLTNPPFTLALLFACQGLRDAKNVCLLLRLNWLSPKRDRLGFLRTYPPEVFVLGDRPSFKHGSTDAQEYAWFCWGECFEPGRYRTLERRKGAGL